VLLNLIAKMYARPLYDTSELLPILLSISVVSFFSFFHFFTFWLRAVDSADLSAFERTLQ